MEDFPIIVSEFSRSVADPTGVWNRDRIRGWVLDADGTDDSPDDLASGPRNRVPGVSLLHELPDKLFQVVTELSGVTHTHPLSEFRERHARGRI
jgi:hypothetical protein